MTPERWQQIDAMVQEALEHETGERAAWVDSACGSDPQLHQQVEKLLLAYENVGSYLETPAIDRLAAVAPHLSSDDLSPDDPGPKVALSRFGPYLAHRCLGQGGMGTVYLAERDDEELYRQVAIKVVHGTPDESTLRRFRSERQILAQLNHPYIANLLDGGTTPDGHPYLVMDYIEGSPIDEHCDAHRLTVNDRLQLFVKVCAAVHYAHQNRVVHRDVKPTNILVTTQGEPRLLDFGIAKLLDPATFPLTIENTRSHLRPMTPNYASPEQVRGEEITERSDVYSLGVLLYQLLCGTLPHRLVGLSSAQMEVLITVTDPVLPSLVVGRSPEASNATVSEKRGIQPQQLHWRLQGDLDNIVMKSLAKEPGRRYDSVEELSDDILRHLGDRPVRARPAGWGYRMGRFVRRHRRAAAVVVLGAAALGSAYFLGSSRTPDGAGVTDGASVTDGSVVLNTVERRPSLAVLGLRNLSEEAEGSWISIAFADMLTSEMAVGEQLRILSGETVS